MLVSYTYLQLVILQLNAYSQHLDNNVTLDSLFEGNRLYRL